MKYQLCTITQNFYIKTLKITLLMANIKIHVPFILRKAKESGAEMV